MSIIEKEKQTTALPTINELLMEDIQNQEDAKDLREFDQELGS